jgi:hypothetical protein
MKQSPCKCNEQDMTCCSRVFRKPPVVQGGSAMQSGPHLPAVPVKATMCVPRLAQDRVPSVSGEPFVPNGGCGRIEGPLQSGKRSGIAEDTKAFVFGAAEQLWLCAPKTRAFLLSARFLCESRSVPSILPRICMMKRRGGFGLIPPAVRLSGSRGGGRRESALHRGKKR